MMCVCRYIYIYICVWAVSAFTSLCLAPGLSLVAPSLDPEFKELRPALNLPAGLRRTSRRSGRIRSQPQQAEAAKVPRRNLLPGTWKIYNYKFHVESSTELLGHRYGYRFRRAHGCLRELVIDIPNLGSTWDTLLTAYPGIGGNDPRPQVESTAYDFLLKPNEPHLEVRITQGRTCNALTPQPHQQPCCRMMMCLLSADSVQRYSFGYSNLDVCSPELNVRSPTVHVLLDSFCRCGSQHTQC